MADSTASIGGNARALEEYQAQKRAEREAHDLLTSGQHGEAAARFEALVAARPDSAELLAYLAIATSLQRSFGYQAKARQLAERAHKLEPESALALTAMCAAEQANGLAARAEKYKERALEACQGNNELFGKIRVLLTLAGVIQKPRSRLRPLLAVVLICAAVFAGLFVFAALLKYGRREYLYRSTDWFFYVRRAVLVVAGLIGIRIVEGSLEKPAGRPVPFALGMALALGWGLVVGFISPVQRVTGAVSSVICMTLLHVGSEEIFFRAFLTRTLVGFMKDARWAVLASALLFGAYHLTYYSFWRETPLLQQLAWGGLIALFAGAPYALLYQRSQSLVPPAVCHVAVNLTMMILSIAAR